MKFVYSLCKYIIIILCCINICTGCNNNKTEIIYKNPKTTDVPGKKAKLDVDGISVINKSNSLNDDDIENLAKEIKDLFYKNWGNSNKLENFKMKFRNEREDGGKLKTDVRVWCDWTATQKPGELPFIIGMKKELEKLKGKKLKKIGKKIIHGFILEFNNGYMVTNNYMEDLEIHFNTDKTSDGYEILCSKYNGENGSILCSLDGYQESDAEMIKKGQKVFRQYLQDELN